jgi:hypothetical protein
VIGGHGTQVLEEGPPLLQSQDEGAVIHYVHARDLRDPPDALAPVRRTQVRHGVRTEGGAYDAFPALLSQRPVVLKVVLGGIGGAQDLDVESFEEGAGAVLGAGETLFQVVVDLPGAPGGRLLRYAEDVYELIGEPEARGGAAEEVEVLTEALPDTPVVRLDGGAVEGRYAEVLHRDAPAVEHPEDVVIGDDEEVGWRAQGRVPVRKEGGWDVPVRAHQW